MIDQLTSYLADVPVWAIFASTWAVGVGVHMVVFDTPRRWSLRHEFWSAFWPIVTPIALPYLALRTIWRRLGKRKVEQDKFGTQIAPGWHLRYDADLADMGRPLMSQRVHDPKPAPYASKLPSGTGSRPNAPWVTRERFDEHFNDVEYNLNVLEARISALEAKPEQGIVTFHKPIGGCVGIGGKRGWRGWKGYDTGVYITNGSRTWYGNPPRGEWIEACTAGADKERPIHGTELVALVAEFLEWEGRQG